MSVPVTTRLSEETVAALARAVEDGAAPDRSSAVAQAVDEWVARHDRARIGESYRRAYAAHPTTEDEHSVLAATRQRAVPRWSAEG